MSGRKSKDDFERFFALSLDMLCIADFNGYFKRLNPAWETTLGYSQAALVSKPYLDFVHPDDRAATLAQARQLTRGIPTIGFENRYRCKDGSYRWLRWNATPFPEQRLVYGIARDITEQKQAEETLRKSEATKHALLTAIPDLLIRMKQDGTYLDVLKHGNFFNLINSDRVAKGINIYDILPFDQAKERMHYIQQALQTGELQVYEYQLVIQGKIHEEEARIVPMEKDEVLVMIRDITNRKRIEKERDRLIAILEASTDHIGILDCQGRVLWNNAQAKKILGLAPDTDISQQHISAYHPQWALEIIQTQGLPTAIQHGIWVGETALLQGDGHELPVSQMIIAHLSAEGEVEYFSTVMRDISQLKQAESALRQSEERYRRIIETTTEGVWMIDTAAKTTFVNQQIADKLGYTIDEMIGMPLFAFMDDDTQAIVASSLQHPHPGFPKKQDLKLRRKDGSELWTIISGNTLFDENGQPTGSIAIVTDITDRMRMEEIRRALEREQELNALKLHFFSMASHEFRNPLSVILFSAQVLENSEPEWLDAKKLRNIRRIQEATKGMSQTLADILTIARAESQKIEFNPKLLDLQQLCDRILEEVQTDLRSKSPIRFTCTGETHNVYLDEKLLRSILINLLSNAIKYSPPELEVDFNVEIEANTVVFTVSDRGIGIPTQDLAHVFEAFHRGENVGSIEGSGLGLAVVKKCVDLHGGQVSVKSRVGQGTTFIVQLPIISIH